MSRPNLRSCAKIARMSSDAADKSLGLPEPPQTSLAEKFGRKRRPHLSILSESSATALTSEVTRDEIDAKKQQQCGDDENFEVVQSGFEPQHWNQILKNIRSMRARRDAPVDSMGAEQCADNAASPETKRFQVLVSLMLSSQTKDHMTHAAMEKLKAHGLTVSNVIATATETISQLIYPVGFYKRKAQYLKDTAELLRDDYNGDIPATIENLCKLPGVGPKMAHLCMLIAWNEQTGIGVDTHVHRISNRLRWVEKPTKLPEQTRVALESWLPRNLWREINLLFVGFGQQTCLPVGPKCGGCLNNSICPYAKKNVHNS